MYITPKSLKDDSKTRRKELKTNIQTISPQHTIYSIYQRISRTPCISTKPARPCVARASVERKESVDGRSE